MKHLKSFVSNETESINESNFSNQRNSKVTLLTLLGMFCSDIDIFLLKNKDQDQDLYEENEKQFSTKEIRDRLEDSMDKVLNALERANIDINKPL